ncbi:MAG: ribosome-associated translation inhibitor RaiA [Betaproteobacteria bacterium]|nr:ribosome-associated translation inhibitor RaiA [Betaproteobacteria bacterium]
MQTPVQIIFHEVAHSPALESLIREKAGKLGTIFPRLIRCHVSIEQPHRHQQQGRLFNVRIALQVPGDELVINRGEHEDVYVALRDAFDAARRQIEEHAQKMRREVKHHANGQPASSKQAGEQQ